MIVRRLIQAAYSFSKMFSSRQHVASGNFGTGSGLMHADTRLMGQLEDLPTQVIIDQN